MCNIEKSEIKKSESKCDHRRLKNKRAVTEIHDFRPSELLDSLLTRAHDANFKVREPNHPGGAKTANLEEKRAKKGKTVIFPNFSVGHGPRGVAGPAG